MSVVPVQAAGGRAPLALSTGSGHHWWDDPGPCPKPQETSWNHGVGRFFLWQFQPMLVGLAVHLTWVAFKSFQFAGPACLYTSDSILGVIRASDYPEQWAACQPLLSSADCERIGGSRGCAWNEERGICDVKQLAKSVDFVFLAPRLSHYMVTDVVYLYIFVFALMIWVTYYVLFRVWSYTSHLGVVSWLAVLTVWLYSLLCRGSYGLYKGQAPLTTPGQICPKYSLNYGPSVGFSE